MSINKFINEIEINELKKNKTFNKVLFEQVGKFIIENNLTPDYGHYITNQIMKPCLQLYSMILEELDGYKHKNDTKSLRIRSWVSERQLLIQIKPETIPDITLLFH